MKKVVPGHMYGDLVIANGTPHHLVTGQIFGASIIRWDSAGDRTVCKSPRSRQAPRLPCTECRARCADLK
jgi:hypothetical protein